MLRFAASTAVSNAAQVRFPLYAVESASVVAARFTLAVSVAGALAESFGGLSLSPDHPAYFAKDDVVNGVVRSRHRVRARPAAHRRCRSRRRRSTRPSTGSAPTRPPTNDDFRAGLTRLEEVAEPAMVICPDALTLDDPLLQADLVGQVVTHCENFRRFAIVDAPDLTTTPTCCRGATPRCRARTPRSTRRTCRSSRSTPTRSTASRPCRRRASSPGSSPAPTGSAACTRRPATRRSPASSGSHRPTPSVGRTCSTPAGST